VPASTVTIAFNVFMNVVIGPDGSLDIQPSVSTAGKSLTFVAERDVVVAVTSCSASAANGGRTRPVRGRDRSAEVTDAIAAWREALSTFEDLGVPDTTQVRNRISTARS
jgi:uncharacterized protein YcgI (DUF1989 family)